MSTKIVHVRGLVTYEDQVKIEEELAMTRLDYRVSLVNQCVIVEGGANEVRVATMAIQAAGFEVV